MRIRGRRFLSVFSSFKESLNRLNQELNNIDREINLLFSLLFKSHWISACSSHANLSNPKLAVFSSFKESLNRTSLWVLCCNRKNLAVFSSFLESLNPNLFHAALKENSVLLAYLQLDHRLPVKRKTLYKDNRSIHVPQPTSSAGKISKGALHMHTSQPTHPPKTNHHTPSLIPP